MEKTEDDKNKIVVNKSAWPHFTIMSLSTSFIGKFAAVGVIWGLGYMNWSLAWLIAPVLISVWRSENKKDNQLRLSTAQAISLMNEKQMIETRMNELPSWVFFPDFDRAEWLNKVLYKAWPSVNHFVRDLCKSTIEPAIVQSLAEYKMKGFQFERLVLGRIPPKINGIKAYEKNTSRNEIILDVDILYAGDCDITFTFGTLKGGITDFQLHGVMRVVLKPLIPVVPLVGGVQLFFLNSPAINFNLRGAADVLDFPGLNETLRKTVIEQVGNFVVLPNKLAIPLSPEVPVESLKTPEPEGVLRIHVVQAKHLMKKDIGVLGKGKSDPYAIIKVGAQSFRTQTIDNTVDPKWDYWCEFVVDHGSGMRSEVLAELYDKDNTGQDDPLGRATMEVARVKKKGMIDTWLTLELAKHGMVHLRLMWFQLSDNVADLQAALLETEQLGVTTMSTALLILYVDSAKNLPCIRGSKQPDVFLEANVGSKSQRTTTVLRSCDPIWEQGFTFLVSNPESSSLNLKITDDKTATSLGILTYNLSNLMEKKSLEDKQQPFNLQDAPPDSKVVLSMTLRILKYEEPEITSDDEDELDITTLEKKINRQVSNISAQSNSVPPSPMKLAKHLSKESVISASSASMSTSAPISSERAPVEEELCIRESAPIPVSATPTLVRRHPSVPLDSGESRLGKIQLNIRYSVPRQKLVILVNKVANLPLPANDPSNIPDPYVKMYLLPDKHKETKRKTAVMKDNCNPTFNEQFEYVVSQAELNTRVLEVSVCTQKGWLSGGSNVMGQIRLNLCDLDFTQSVTTWFDLQPESKD